MKLKEIRKSKGRIPKNNKCKYCGSPCVGDYCSILHNSYPDKGALVIEGKKSWEKKDENNRIVCRNWKSTSGIKELTYRTRSSGNKRNR